MNANESPAEAATMDEWHQIGFRLEPIDVVRMGLASRRHRDYLLADGTVWRAALLRRLNIVNPNLEHLAVHQEWRELFRGNRNLPHMVGGFTIGSTQAAYFVNLIGHTAPQLFQMGAPRGGTLPHMVPGLWAVAVFPEMPTRIVVHNVELHNRHFLPGVNNLIFGTGGGAFRAVGSTTFGFFDQARIHDAANLTPFQLAWEGAVGIPGDPNVRVIITPNGMASTISGLETRDYVFGHSSLRDPATLLHGMGQAFQISSQLAE